MILPAAKSVIPPKSMITPPIMLRIAIIVTPDGRDLGLARKLSYCSIKINQILTPCFLRKVNLLLQYAIQQNLIELGIKLAQLLCTKLENGT